MAWMAPGYSGGYGNSWAPPGYSGGYGRPNAMYGGYTAGLGGPSGDGYIDWMNNVQNNATQQYLGNLGYLQNMYLGRGGWQNNVDLANINQQTQLGISGNQLQGIRDQVAGQNYQAGLGLQGQQYVSDNQLRGINSQVLGNNYQGELGLAGQQYVSNNNLAGQQYTSDNQLRGIQGTNQANIDQARIGVQGALGTAQLANVPSYLQQERFGQILPLFQNVLGQGGQQPRNISQEPGYFGPGAGLAQRSPQAGGGYYANPATPGQSGWGPSQAPGATPPQGGYNAGYGKPQQGQGTIQPQRPTLPQPPGGGAAAGGGAAGGAPQYYASPATPGSSGWGGQGTPGMTPYQQAAAFGNDTAGRARFMASGAGRSNNPYSRGGAQSGAGNGAPQNTQPADNSSSTNAFSYSENAPTAAQQVPLDPTISPLQERQLINQAIGANEADYGRAVLEAREGLGARGWSPNSPAISDFIGRADLNRAMANTQARTNVPIDVARGNRADLIALLNANTGAAGVNVGAYSAENNARNNYLDTLVRLMG